MRALDRGLTFAENFLATAALAVAAFVAIVSVLLRFVFGIHLSWSEEVIIYAVIYSTFFGAVITLRHDEHVKVDIIAPLVGKLGKRVMAVLGGVVTVAYLGIIGFFGWLLLFEPFSSATVTPTLKLPLWVVELSVPLGLTLMFVRAVEMLYRALRGETTFAEAEVSELEKEAEALGMRSEEVRV